MQRRILRSCFGGSARSVGLLPAILLLWFAPSAPFHGQDVGSSTGSVFHVHGVVLNVLTNKPVGRALVTCMDLAAMTNGEGRFEFDVRLSTGNTAGGPGPATGVGIRGGGGDG